MSLSIADLERKQKLPPELANLEPKFARIVPLEPSSVCTLHGPMDGPNCEECDKFFPDAVKARAITAATPAVGAVTIEQLLANPIVQKMIQDSIAEQIKFQAWKSSAEGQQAAAAAITSQATEEAKAAVGSGMTAEEEAAALRARLAELEGGKSASGA